VSEQTGDTNRKEVNPYRGYTFKKIGDTYFKIKSDRFLPFEKLPKNAKIV
jgi:hypothetical protein